MHRAGPSLVLDFGLLVNSARLSQSLTAGNPGAALTPWQKWFESQTKQFFPLGG